jgi:hypothetical protein
MKTLVKYNFREFNDAADLRGEVSDFARGSMNQMPLGSRQYRPFRNNTEVGVGSRLMFQVSDTFGGLDDIGGDEAKGSLFTSIADALLYIGNGQVSVEGVELAGIVATELLRVTLKYLGSYTDPLSYTYVVGMTAPSAPTVSAISTSVPFTPITNGEYSFKIARLRESTGGKSKASATSAVLLLVAQGVALVLPAASTGQTHWIIFVTNKGLGGVGLHYRIARANPYTGLEYTEDDVQRSISTLSVTNGSPNVSSSAGVFTAGDVGKRFNPVSAGFSVPGGTTIATVTNSTNIILSNNVTVSSGSNPRTAELIAYAGGVDRSVLLNWKESDLNEAAELDWIYDYPPPSGSHAFQLESRIVVATRADSTLEASAENAGTALIFSLSNQLESFDLRFPLYLPSGVIDVIGRGIDSYSFIGTRNGIYALQFINSDFIPATVSVILGSEGIANRGNWTISGRGLYIAVGKGSLVRIGEGGKVDTLWFDAIRRYIQDWEQEDIVIINDPKNKGITVSHGDESFFYDEQTNRWSTTLDMRDSSPGTIISGIGARSQMYFTAEVQGTPDVRTAYSFDTAAGSYTVGIAPFVGMEKEEQIHAQRMTLRFENDRADRSSYLLLQKNNQVTAVTDAAITVSTNILVSNTAKFTEKHLGNYILIKGAGSDVEDWMIARIIGVVDDVTVNLGTIADDLSNSVPFYADATVSGAYCIIGCRLYEFNSVIKGTNQRRTPEFYHPGLHSIAATLLLFTVGDHSQPINIQIHGGIEESWDFDGVGYAGETYTPPGEDGGNRVSDKPYLPAAGRYGSTVQTFWDLPASPDAPTPLAVGTNVKKAVLEFPNTSGEKYAENHLILPDDWIGQINIRVLFSTPGTSGNVKWKVYTSYTDLVNSNDPDDNAYNVANSAITAAPSNANDATVAVLNNITTTGAVPGSQMHIKIARDANDAADTLAASAYFEGMEVTLQRS